MLNLAIREPFQRTHTFAGGFLVKPMEFFPIAAGMSRGSKASFFRKRCKDCIIENQHNPA